MPGVPSNLFKHAREIAQHCKDRKKRVHLRMCTDEAQYAFCRFAGSAAIDDMEVLVARWSRLLIAIELVGPLPGGDPAGAGKLTLPTTGGFVHDPDVLDVIQKLTRAA